MTVVMIAIPVPDKPRIISGQGQLKQYKDQRGEGVWDHTTLAHRFYPGAACEECYQGRFV